MHFRNIDSRHLTWIIILRTEDNMLPLCWQRWCSVTATPHYPPISIVGIFSLTKLKLQFVSVCLLQRVKENAQSRLTNGGFVWPRFCWFMFRLYKVFNGKISLLGDRLLIICNTCWLISWYGIFARRGHILIWGASREWEISEVKACIEVCQLWFTFHHNKANKLSIISGFARARVTQWNPLINALE